MQTVTYTIPDFFLPALFNGDDTGLDPFDLEALERFQREEPIGFALAVAGDDQEGGAEPFFTRHHDMTRYGILASTAVAVVFEDLS